MTQIAGLIMEVLKSKGEPAVALKVKVEVQKLTGRFGLPADI